MGRPSTIPARLQAIRTFHRESRDSLARRLLMETETLAAGLADHHHFSPAQRQRIHQQFHRLPHLTPKP